MKSFTKNIFRNLALFALGAAALSACGGAGSCSTCAPTPTPGSLTLSIEAPSQYPAGVAVTAYLTMTNTSNVNGNNLVYTVPSATNYTGVSITANPTGAGENCANIAAGASCTFTASIPAGSKPGSFVVLATPNSTSAGSTTQSGKSFQADSISVTANLGLVDVPNTQNQYYILPSAQTIISNVTGSTTVMISVWVKQASEGLSSLRLVDEAGAALSYVTVGTPSYALNSVNTYLVTIPAGKTLQHIQALSNVCETLNNGDNNYTACSNDADVNLAVQGNGILSIQPTQFNLSESYNSQVITLTNTGTGDVSSITYPTFSTPFSVVTNNCSSLTKLIAGQSCTLTVKYTAGVTSGESTAVFGYDDDNNVATEPKNTSIILGYTAAVGPGPDPEPATPFSTLSVTPSPASLTAENPRKVFTITNTPGGSTAGVTIAGGWTLPTLSAPLELESTNCYASDGLVGLADPSPTTNSLAVGASCTYTIKYSSAVSAGSATLPFTYNNGINSQTTNVAIDWSQYTPHCTTSCSIFLSDVVSNGNLGATWEDIDDICMNSTNKPDDMLQYKAMIVGTKGATTRQACSSGNCTTDGSNENVNWVLKPNTTYVWSTATPGQVAFITNGTGIAPMPILNQGNPGGFTIWTGLNQDWTTDSSNTCTGWSYSASGLGRMGNSGVPGNGNFIGTVSRSCADNRQRLYCIAQ